MAAEAELERKARKYVESLGGLLVKWAAPGNRGVPDRILLLNGCPVVFVEFKAPGKPLKPLQRQWSRRLMDLGFAVWAPVHDIKAFEFCVGYWIEKHAAP